MHEIGVSGDVAAYREMCNARGTLLPKLSVSRREYALAWCYFLDGSEQAADQIIAAASSGDTKVERAATTEIPVMLAVTSAEKALSKLVNSGLVSGAVVEKMAARYGEQGDYSGALFLLDQLESLDPLASDSTRCSRAVIKSQVHWASGDRVAALREVEAWKDAAVGFALPCRDWIFSMSCQARLEIQSLRGVPTWTQVVTHCKDALSIGKDISTIGNLALALSWPSVSGDADDWSAVMAIALHLHLDLQTSDISVRALRNVLAELRCRPDSGVFQHTLTRLSEAPMLSIRARETLRIMFAAPRCLCVAPRDRLQHE